MAIPIGAFLNPSFLDWDGRVSAVLFCIGCPFRCPFCHNARLVLGGARPRSFKRILASLRKTKKFLDGLVLSGGEPAMYPSLPETIRALREETGLPVKLDTNGLYPEMLAGLLEEKLIDAVAMDVKGPMESYSLLAGVRVDTNRIRRSMDLLTRSGAEVLFRTTYVPDLMTERDLLEMRLMMQDRGRWVVQLFRPGVTLAKELRQGRKPDPDRLRALLPGVEIRGRE